ncbi:MAG: CCA tRNA nucleotidyltransferase [Oscillospiraceae bacterium]|nr:CCA tRNA nucleotidyltransferase [Oscillospiraceae bacterium]
MFPKEVESVLQALEGAGYRAYAVGGCVRDLLRGVEPDDYDITTSARPEEVMALFKGHCIPTGLQHGTVTVRQNHRSFEVTTFRADGVYTDNRHPSEVFFSQSLEEDLRRRDFTINAMAMDLRGEVTDLYGGREDLQRGIIRCVGDADTRFTEDALRIMRALRFASRLGFTIEADTARSIRKNRALLQNIAVERILVEMNKLLTGAGAGQILLDYPEVLQVFLPEIAPCVGFEQHSKYHCYTVWEHIVHAVESVAAEPILRWTMLLHDIAKPPCFFTDEQGEGHFYGHPQRSAEMAAEITRRLKFDKRSAQRIVLLVEWHDREIAPTHKSVRRVLNAIGEEALRQLLQVKRADNMAQHEKFRYRLKEIDAVEAVMDELLAQECCFSLKQLAVNGRDLMALGLQGSEIGAALDALLQKVMDGELPNEKDALVQYVKEKKKP